jgi:hypothetical protein
MSPPTPRAELEGFLAKFTPAVAANARQALARLRILLPGSIELVYDNYNALAIGFGPTERASDVVCSIAVFPRWVSLFLMQGARLPDPQGVLRGKGKQARHIVLESADTLDRPEVRALLEQAVDLSNPWPDRSRPGRIVIKSISAKQRPRRPA